MLTHKIEINFRNVFHITVPNLASSSRDNTEFPVPFLKAKFFLQYSQPKKRMEVPKTPSTREIIQQSWPGFVYLPRTL